MSGVAIVVGVFFVVLAAACFDAINRVSGREAEMKRTYENLKRLSLARKVGDDFYTYEDEHGSLLWRRVSAD